MVPWAGTPGRALRPRGEAPLLLPRARGGFARINGVQPGPSSKASARLSICYTVGKKIGIDSGCAFWSKVFPTVNTFQAILSADFNTRLPFGLYDRGRS